jgi:signal peptidase I
LKHAFKELLQALVIGAVVFLSVQVGIKNAMVEGSSMEPTLMDSERMLVNKLVYLRVDMQRFSSLIPFWQVEEQEYRYLFHSPGQGDVVILRYEKANPDKDLVKRVVAVPGQAIEVRHGVVYVDGDPLDEPYVPAKAASRDSMAPLTLGPDQYFVMGDNRAASYDSRSWGPLPAESIIGKAWVIYWPFSKMNVLETPEH